jgi:hypothetical protein
MRGLGMALLVLAAMAVLDGCARVAVRGGEERYRVAVISDLNGPYGSVDYGAEVGEGLRLIMEEWRPDLVLAAGDLVAGQRPSLEDAQVRRARIPFGFALGNHDASAYPAHERDRRLAVEHWSQPAHDAGLTFVDRAAFPLYYSFRQGPVFIVAWDATWQGTLSDEPLMEWLGAQLSGDVARDAAFRVVLGHLPLYAVAEGRDHEGEVLAGADSLRALLERHNVDLYVSGHHHAYYPGVRGGLELLHAGALGDGPRPLIGATEPSPRTVTLLDFHPARGDVVWTTFAVDRNGPPRLVRTSTLPARIDGFNGWVERRSEAVRR